MAGRVRGGAVGSTTSLRIVYSGMSVVLLVAFVAEEVWVVVPVEVESEWIRRG